MVESLLDKYKRWRQTPHGKEVYRLSLAMALKVWYKGIEHYSIDMIVCVVRYHRALESGVDEQGYKVSNNHRAYLARDLMANNAPLKGFFTIRETQDEKMGQQELSL